MARFIGTVCVIGIVTIGSMALQPPANVPVQVASALLWFMAGMFVHSLWAK